MRADHAVLVSGRRGPLCRSLTNNKAGDRNIADSFLGRIENISSDVDLYIFLIRILSPEIRENESRSVLLLCIPGLQRRLRIPGASVDDRMEHLFKVQDLIHGLSIQINLTCMDRVRRKIPVAADRNCVRIIIPEDSIRNPADIYVSLIPLPILDRLRACNHSASHFLRAVGDACIFRTCVLRVHVFTVYARSYDYFVTGHRDISSLLNCLERALLRPAAAAKCRGRYIVIHTSNPPYICVIML